MQVTYEPLMKREETEEAIRKIKDYFKISLCQSLNLDEISSPLTVLNGTGINDDLNGMEKPVRFTQRSFPNREIEIVQSLAKWKRNRLYELKTEPGKGILTHMHAIRPGEKISQLHSFYVDQWDWEKRIGNNERDISTLKSNVHKIYHSIFQTEKYITSIYTALKPVLPEKITFIHAEDLHQQYPDLSSGEREDIIAQKYGAIFIIGIGHRFQDGTIHDFRAPDYDDWSTSTSSIYKGLNGDIILWSDVLHKSIEIFSMGIRVDKKSLITQLKLTHTMHRKNLPFHKKIILDQLPQTIGGGIGQSRLCMFLLKKLHIGEVQSSLWPDDEIKNYSAQNAMFL